MRTRASTAVSDGVGNIPTAPRSSASMSVANESDSPAKPWQGSLLRGTFASRNHASGCGVCQGSRNCAPFQLRNLSTSLGVMRQLSHQVLHPRVHASFLRTDNSWTFTLVADG